MEAASKHDLECLQHGQPPLSADLLRKMTVGREKWLDYIDEHYLENFICTGGSKVKIIVGNEGSGKSHLMKNVILNALDRGYVTVYLSARKDLAKISDLKSLYKAVVSGIDTEELTRGLCLRVAKQLGYEKDAYDGTNSVVPLMLEKGIIRQVANRDIQEAAAAAFRKTDIGVSFIIFAYLIIKNRMRDENNEGLQQAMRWLKGEKLELSYRKATGLYELLNRTSARYWLNSLIKLLNLAGKKGLVLAIDDVEVITERSLETDMYLYTTSNVKDTCELVRQIIDDAELLQGLFLLIGGRRTMIADERRGLLSYQALQLRLQTGLVESGQFNPLADLIDVDLLASSYGAEFHSTISAKLADILRESGFPKKRAVSHAQHSPSLLRSAVMDVAHCYG